MNNILKDRRVGDVMLIMLIGMILPPFFSTLYAFYMTTKYRRKEYGIAFIFFFVLFLTYNFFSIDNIGRHLGATGYFYDELWFLDDPLTSLMHWGITNLSLQSSHFFFLYIFLVYFLLFTIFSKSVDDKINVKLMLIFILAISLRSSMDLLYYCLSVAFAFWFISNKKYKLVNILLLIVVVYLLHPGFLLLLLPSMGLYLGMSLSMNNRKYIYWASLLIVYVFSYILSHTTFLNETGIPILDEIFGSYNSYVDDGAWGQRSGNRAISGITYTIAFYIVPFIYFIAFMFSVKYYALLKNKEVLSVFQTAMLFYPSYINFVTLSERNLLVLSISFVLVLLMLMEVKAPQLKFLSLDAILSYCILIGAFNFIKMDGAVKLYNVFRTDTYVEVRNRSYYMPSILLFDYGSFGYSNEFINKNTYIVF